MKINQNIMNPVKRPSLVLSGFVFYLPAEPMQWLDRQGAAGTDKENRLRDLLTPKK